MLKLDLADSLESRLCDTIREIVRDEIRKALAETRKPDDGYLSCAAAGRLASVSIRTIQRWIENGSLVAHRVGAVVRVRRADLERLLREGRGGSGDRERTAEELVRRRLARL